MQVRSSHLKILCFPILRGKINFAPGNDGEGEEGAGAPSFPYGVVYSL